MADEQIRTLQKKNKKTRLFTQHRLTGKCVCDYEHKR